MQSCMHIAIHCPFTQCIVWKCILQHSIRLHVCMYVRFVATSDKYTCSEPTGSSLDCARGVRIRAVIFHIYTQPTWVYLEEHFYEDKCYIVPCVCLCVHCMYCLLAQIFFLSESVFYNCGFFICLQWHFCGSSSFGSTKLLLQFWLIYFHFISLSK